MAESKQEVGMNCPLCKSLLTYQGLTEVYCSGPSTCPNVDKDVLAARKIEEEARNLAWPVAGPFNYFKFPPVEYQKFLLGKLEVLSLLVEN